MTGILLAGVGVRDDLFGTILWFQKLTASFKHVTEPPESQKNYLVVDGKTDDATIEEAFDQFTRQRKDIAIVLINQHVRQAR